MHTQKAIRNAERFEDKGIKFETELDRLKRVLEKMVSKNPSGASDELDQISEELAEYENVHHKIHQLFSGLNPNSFPQEGESETFLQNKFRDLSFQVIRRIAQICAKVVSVEVKETQTYKEMTDQYYIEMKAEQQDEIIKDQLRKLDDLQARMKLKNQKLSLFSKENRELHQKVKQKEKDVQELNIDNKSLQDRVEKFRHNAEVAEKKYKLEHKKNVEAQEQVDLARDKARRAELRAEQLKAVAASFTTPKSMDHQTLESGVESSLETPSNLDRKFLFPPKQGEITGGSQTSEKPRSSRSNRMYREYKEGEESRRSSQGQTRGDSPLGLNQEIPGSIPDKLKQIESSVAAQHSPPRDDAPSIVTYTLDPALQKQMAEMEKLKQTLNARKSIGEHSSIGNLSTEGPSQTEGVSDTRRSRLPTENSFMQNEALRSASIDQEESLKPKGQPIKVRELDLKKKKISEQGGRKGLKELEMVSRKFGKGANSSLKSKFANEGKKVLQEEDKDDLIEEIEEPDDASTSYQGVRESRQKTVRSKGKQYEKEEESQQSRDEFEREEEPKQGPRKVESACYSSELEINPERREQQEIERIRVDQRSQITPRIGTQYTEDGIQKESEQVQTELTLPIMSYMTSQLPRQVYKECIRAPISGAEERRIEAIVTMQKEKQNLFQKYGYRIKGGSMATEQTVLSQTFSSNFKPRGPNSPPRDAPNCLVVKRNPEGPRNKQMYPGYRSQRGNSEDYYRTR